MHCRYCRAWNNEEEHRCTRCGRRLHLANPRPAPDTYPIQTATAPDLIGLAEHVGETNPNPIVEPQPARLSYQRSLFREMQAVMQIPVLVAADTKESKLKPPKARPAKRSHSDQQAFDFNSPRIRTSLEAIIYCDAPVAAPEHRLIAAAIDASLILIALSVFILTFHFSGGTVNLQRLPAFGIAGVVLWIFYQALFCFANGDTPGTAWAGLRDITFEGRRPTREQRAFRLLATCVSLFAAGLGVLWALVDEEKLTWFDHMSKTFTTPRSC